MFKSYNRNTNCEQAVLRFINDTARNAPLNMALDEILFESICAGSSSALRVYMWDSECSTIGYFQKNAYNPPAVRRFTGGLLVCHGTDISYSFNANSSQWPFVYNQELTYKNIHTCIQSALREQAVDCELSAADFGKPNGICVQTVYNYDLMSQGKKIAGSCQRRRGKNIFVQGSVHVNSLVDKNAFALEFARDIAEIMNAGVLEKSFTSAEISAAQILSQNKYSSDEWNLKY